MVCLSYSEELVFRATTGPEVCLLAHDIKYTCVCFFFLGGGGGARSHTFDKLAFFRENNFVQILTRSRELLLEKRYKDTLKSPVVYFLDLSGALRLHEAWHTKFANCTTPIPSTVDTPLSSFRKTCTVLLVAWTM